MSVSDFKAAGPAESKSIFNSDNPLSMFDEFRSDRTDYKEDRRQVRLGWNDKY
jgi:hypothetical protein